MAGFQNGWTHELSGMESGGVLPSYASYRLICGMKREVAAWMRLRKGDFGEGKVLRIKISQEKKKTQWRKSKRWDFEFLQKITFPQEERTAGNRPGFTFLVIQRNGCAPSSHDVTSRRAAVADHWPSWLPHDKQLKHCWVDCDLPWTASPLDIVEKTGGWETREWGPGIWTCE